MNIKKMKAKNVMSLILSVFLLALFVPVFYYTIFVGNHVNYNEEHKIETLCSNKMLLVYVILAVIVFSGLCYLFSKIPFNKYTIAGTVAVSLITCIVFYVVKVKVSKCIAFYGGWDCGMVANSARWVLEGTGIGYEDYYYIYSNNIPITWLLYVLYKFSSTSVAYPYNPEFIWIQFQCLMFALAIFFSVMTVLMVSKKIAPAILCLFVNVVFWGLCPWQIIPYTDAVTVAMPVLTVFLYTCFRHMKSKGKYMIWLLCVFTGLLGGIMKANCYVAVIAVVLLDSIWLILGRDNLAGKVKKLVFHLILAACAFLLASCCKKVCMKRSSTFRIMIWK